MEIVRKEVDFNGTELVGLKIKNKIYIVVKSICENLGIFANSQIKRINRDDTLRQGAVKMTLPSNRGNQETNLLELDYLPLWLTGIKANQCREDIRPHLKEFKLKAKDVLAAAFLNNDQPKQLSLPKEHKIIKKYYNGVPVMSIMDLATIAGRRRELILYHAPKNKTMIHKYEMEKFKEENPNLPNALVHMTILYKEEVINICKRIKVYKFVKPQISAYFDDFIPEGEKVSNNVQEVTTDENTKAEKLMQVLPHITEESLKNRVAEALIRMIDNKILEDHKIDGLHIRFIDSTEKILEVREFNGFKMTVVETDKPIEEFVSPKYAVSSLLGNKVIFEKK